MSASLWGVAFLPARRGSARRWSLEPRRSCAPFQTHPACTWAERRRTQHSKQRTPSAKTRSSPEDVHADNTGSFPKGKRLWGCFDYLAAAVFCQRLNKRQFWNKITQTTVDSLLSLNIPPGRHLALDIVNAETGENISESCGKLLFERDVFFCFLLNFEEKMCEYHEKYGRYATFPIEVNCCFFFLFPFPSLCNNFSKTLQNIQNIQKRHHNGGYLRLFDLQGRSKTGSYEVSLNLEQIQLPN